MAENDATEGGCTQRGCGGYKSDFMLKQTSQVSVHKIICNKTRFFFFF